MLLLRVKGAGAEAEKNEKSALRNAKINQEEQNQGRNPTKSPGMDPLCRKKREVPQRIGRGTLDIFSYEPCLSKAENYSNYDAIAGAPTGVYKKVTGDP